MGAVRIIGGACRRRIVRFPNILGLRPTSDRVRETLFNWLGRDLTGWSCLDLFAGSGVLGLEASSRGAASAVLVDSNLAVCRSIEKAANELKLGGISVVRSDVLMFLNRISRHEKRNFDLVFIDPPFRQSLVCPVLSMLSAFLRPDARVYVETEHEFVLPDGWVVDRQLRAGQVLARLLLLQSSVGG